MDAAVERPHAEGFDVRDEDAARLSPFGGSHVNLLGRYLFQHCGGLLRDGDGL
jgi:hypothetical protein